jgi:hypothetical protein
LILLEVRSYVIRYYPDAAADALLGFIPSKVFSLIASKDAFTSSSSCVLQEKSLRGKIFTLYLRVSKNDEVGLSPKRLPTFVGFVPLSILLTLWCPLNPGLWIHLEARGASPPPDHVSSGWARTDRSSS